MTPMSHTRTLNLRPAVPGPVHVRRPVSRSDLGIPAPIGTPCKWQQFGDDELRILAQRYYPKRHPDVIRAASREELVAMIEKVGPA